MIGVLGGGFGLYGHLAALAGLGRQVHTLRRYRPVLEARPELAPLLDRVAFVDDADELLSAEILVLARRPQDNLALSRDYRGSSPERGMLVIEKPIAPDPVGALALHDELSRRAIEYRTPYLFLHTDWGDALVAAAAPREIDISWHFPQRNSATSWKQDVDAGGGVLGYYLIHFLPLAVLLDMTGAVDLQQGGASAHDWMEITATGPGGSLRVRMELGDVEATFAVTVDGQPVWAGDGPFGPNPQRGKADTRLPVLQRFYQREVLAGEEGSKALYGPSLQLWQDLSSRTSAPIAGASR